MGGHGGASQREGPRTQLLPCLHWLRTPDGSFRHILHAGRKTRAALSRSRGTRGEEVRPPPPQAGLGSSGSESDSTDSGDPAAPGQGTQACLPLGVL